MLMFCCLFVVGNYFCYDNPAVLELELEKKMDLTSSVYGLLYTVYAIPNTLLPLVGGIMLDKMGIRNGLVLFTFITCVGQGLFMLGGYNENFVWMIFGRVLFGIGSETMYVGQSAIVSSWFINFELSTAMAMVSAIPLVGSFMNGAMLPTIYEKYNNFGIAFSIGFLICLICFFLVLIIYYIDLKVEKNDSKELKKFEIEQDFVMR